MAFNGRFKVLVGSVLALAWAGAAIVVHRTEPATQETARAPEPPTIEQLPMPQRSFEAAFRYDPTNGTIDRSGIVRLGDLPRQQHTYDPTNGTVSSSEGWRVKD